MIKASLSQNEVHINELSKLETLAMPTKRSATFESFYRFVSHDPLFMYWGGWSVRYVDGGVWGGW